jgi:hypothetical protein
LRHGVSAGFPSGNEGVDRAGSRIATRLVDAREGVGFVRSVECLCICDVGTGITGFVVLWLCVVMQELDLEAFCLCHRFPRSCVDE